MTMYKRNARANNNQLLTIYQGVHITHFMYPEPQNLKVDALPTVFTYSQRCQFSILNNNTLCQLT